MASALAAQRHVSLRTLTPALALLAFVTACSTTVAGTPAPADLAAPPTQASAPTDVGTPQRITIPALHVDAPIVPEGLQADGQLQIPDVHQVGWYKGSPDPGNTGPSLLAAHVDWSGTPGIFVRLAELKPGDTITVTGTKGSATFAVTTVATEPKPQVDWRTVLANVPDAEIIAVTCGGTVTDHQFSNNVIVRARATGGGT